MGFISLEPAPLLYQAPDEVEPTLFSRPARLQDVNENSEVFTRDDPEKGLGDRLKRVWTERGEYAGRDDEVEEDAIQEGDTKLSATEMRTLQESLLQQLDLARSELTTALDLLSVLSAPTDPPSVDEASLPLPQETLTLVKALPPPPVIHDSTNPLPLATSLASLRSSASAFFGASDSLLGESEISDEVMSNPASTPRTTKRRSSPTPDPWPLLLSLHSLSARTMIPLGATKGATLTGKQDARVARTVGIFYGCEEANERFRAGSVIRIGELLQRNTLGENGIGARKERGRSMVLSLRMGEKEKRAVWEEKEEVNDRDHAIEMDLRALSRAAFAEELFATLSNEAKADPTLKAQLILGKRSIGDSILTQGHGWSLTITMINDPSLLPPLSSSFSSASQAHLAQTLLPTLRLLFLREYKTRRLVSSPPPSSSSQGSRPLLGTLSTLITLAYRRETLRGVLEGVKEELLSAQRPEEDVEEVGIEFYGANNVLRSNSRRGDAEDLVEGVVRMLDDRGCGEIGGRAILRLKTTYALSLFCFVF